MRIEYPQFSPLRYGIALDNPRNKPLICAESFFLGDVLVTQPSKLEQEIEEWLRFRSQKHDFSFLFDFDGEIQVPLSSRKKSKRRLTDLTPAQLVFALLKKIKLHDKTLSIWNYHSENAVLETSSGTQILTGKIKSIGDARESQRTKYHLVEVDDPFAHNCVRFNNISCTCEDSFWTSSKQGNRNLQVMCVHTAAMIDFLSRNPEKIKNYQKINDAMKNRDSSFKNIELVVPFHTDNISQEVMKWFKDERLSYISKEEQPSLSNLKIDVLLARYFMNESYFNLAKSLLKLPIYDSFIIDMLIDGKARFEVVPSKQLFGVDSVVAEPVKKLHEALDNSFYRNRFYLSGCVLEKKDSPYEVVAINYLKKSGESARVIFSSKHPPLVVKRTPIDGARFTPFKDYRTKADFFYHLYYKERVGKEITAFDDSTRKNTIVSVELPHCFIPSDLLADYREAINKYTPGGCRALVKLAEQGKLDRKSLFYKIEKA